MKKIRRNAVKQMERILKNVSKIEYFNSENNYQGGKFAEGLTEKELRNTLFDLREGYALLFEKEDGSHVVRYAGRCRWELS
jgi:hypothetical protein